MLSIDQPTGESLTITPLLPLMSASGSALRQNTVSAALQNSPLARRRVDASYRARYDHRSHALSDAASHSLAAIAKPDHRPHSFRKG